MIPEPAVLCPCVSPSASTARSRRSASFEFILWTAVFGGLLSLALIVARRDVAPHIVGGPVWVHTLLEAKGDIPYGIAIAVGALMAFPSSALLAAFAAG